MNSLSHISCECKCRIVFTPKYRRQVIYGKVKAEIGKYFENYVIEKE